MLQGAAFGAGSEVARGAVRAASEAASGATTTTATNGDYKVCIDPLTASESVLHGGDDAKLCDELRAQYASCLQNSAGHLQTQYGDCVRNSA